MSEGEPIRANFFCELHQVWHHGTGVCPDGWAPPTADDHAFLAAVDTRPQPVTASGENWQELGEPEG